MKCRPHPALHFFIPGEGTAPGFGENFAQCLAVFFRLFPIRECQVEIAVKLVACLCSQGPFVLVRGVVEHKICNKRDAVPGKFPRERGELVDGAKRRVRFPVARNSISPIVLALRRFEKGHEMQIFDAQLFQIWKALLNPAECPCPPIHIAHRTDYILAQVPTAFRRVLPVARFEPGRPLSVRFKRSKDNIFDPVRKIGPVAVQLEQKAGKPLKLVLEARAEFRPTRIAGQAPGGESCGKFLFECIKSLLHIEYIDPSTTRVKRSQWLESLRPGSNPSALSGIVDFTSGLRSHRFARKKQQGDDSEQIRQNIEEFSRQASQELDILCIERQRRRKTEE